VTPGAASSRRWQHIDVRSERPLPAASPGWLTAWRLSVRAAAAITPGQFPGDQVARATESRRIRAASGLPPFRFSDGVVRIGSAGAAYARPQLVLTVRLRQRVMGSLVSDRRVAQSGVSNDSACFKVSLGAACSKPPGWGPLACRYLMDEAIGLEPFHVGRDGQGSTCGCRSEVAVRAGPPGLRRIRGSGLVRLLARTEAIPQEVSHG